VETPFLRSVHHCILETNDVATEQLSSLVKGSLLKLEDHDLSDVDFHCLPEYPRDCIEDQMCVPFIDVGRQKFDDADGHHMFCLLRLRRSLVNTFADVPKRETELFCRRWSQHTLYSPFEGWQGVPLEVAEQKCHEMAFQRLHPFFTHFRPLCQKALAEGKQVYVLWERHERPMA
jgi:hypothetical protein